LKAKVKEKLNKENNTMEIVNVKDKISRIKEYWQPKIIGELNNQLVKVAKLKGEFIMHRHDNEDELFYVVEGSLEIELKEKTIRINEGDFVIIPKGIEHKPIAQKEVLVMMFEPNTTLNTGNVLNELTQKQLEKL
jgi:mannose-6-phosphate isomerase-like protein (cupin superfamily)